MKILNVSLLIGKYVYYSVSSFEIESSWETLTDTATFRFPQNLRINGLSIKEVINVRDVVIFDCGYGNNRTRRFAGVVTEVSPADIVEIKCEDGAWYLKQLIVEKYSAPPQQLSKMMDDLLLLPKLTVQAELGSYRASNVTRMDILNNLRETYSLYSFFRGDILTIGVPYDGSGTKYVFNLTGVDCNVADSSNLVYNEVTETQIVLKGTSFLENNTKLELWCYWEKDEIVISKVKKEGAIRTQNYYNLSLNGSKQALQAKLPNIIYTGYKGYFTTFLDPVLQHGDKVLLLDLKNEDRQGTYLVKKVVTEMSVSGGGKQHVYLDTEI